MSIYILIDRPLKDSAAAVERVIFSAYSPIAVNP